MVYKENSEIKLMRTQGYILAKLGRSALCRLAFLLWTRREQEIPHFYKWWDELRITRRSLDFYML